MRGTGSRGCIGRCGGGGNLALLLLPHKHVAHDEDEDSIAQVDTHQNEGQHIRGIVSGCAAQDSCSLRGWLKSVHILICWLLI